MKVNVGDVIRYTHDGVQYCAVVDAILEEGEHCAGGGYYYGVHTVYEQFGLQQDMISPGNVDAVYKLSCERVKDSDIKCF